MSFSIYLPPQSEATRASVLYWLSGLTCTFENFMKKAGVQCIASKLGIAIIAGDTSPRGESVKDDESGAYDLGLDTPMMSPVLIDQGDRDEFLNDQFKPVNIKHILKVKDCPIGLRFQPGYDHGYFFISSF